MQLEQVQSIVSKLPEDERNILKALYGDVNSLPDKVQRTKRIIDALPEEDRKKVFDSPQQKPKEEEEDNSPDHIKKFKWMLDKLTDDEKWMIRNHLMPKQPSLVIESNI